MDTVFLVPRLDFVLFLHLLGLLFLSAFSLYLYRQGRKVEWVWLSLFALAHGMSIAVEMVSRVVREAGVLHDLGLSLGALSFFFLSLFGLHCLGLRKGRFFGYIGVAAIGLLPVACAVVWGAEGFSLGIRLGLGPSAGGLALLGALHETQAHRERYGLALTLTPLLVLYLAALSVFPVSHMAVRAVFDGWDSWLLPLPQVPYAVLMAVLCSAVVAAFARSVTYLEAEESGEQRKGLVAYVCGFSAIGVAVFVGFALTDTLGASAERSVREELFMRVSAVGNALDPEEVRKLDVAGSEPDSEGYRRLLVQLTKIRLSNPDLRFVYLVNLRPDRQVAIVLDTEPPTSVDYSPPGEIYTEAPTELQSVFSSGKTNLVGPYTDRWGTWISGFSPVKDEVGAIFGVVGMDIDSKNLQVHVAMTRFMGIVITFLLAVIGASVGIILQRNKDLGAMNQRLADEVRERQVAERHLADSERQYRQVVEMANDGIAVFQDGKLRFANSGFARIMNSTVRELQGESMENLFAEQERAAVANFHNSRMAGEDVPGQLETVLLTKALRRVPVEMNAEIISYADRVADLVVMRDVTVRKRAEDALRESERHYKELSFQDELTQLYNARSFMRNALIEMRRAEVAGNALSLVLMDIDEFKAFNDAYGHVEGDNVLRELGRIITREIRDTDKGYRYGGEEFVVLLPETSGEAALRLAERIRLAFSAQIYAPREGLEVNRTLSLGVAVYRSGEDLQAFLDRADRNMYMAKEKGKDRTVWEENV